MDHVMEKPGVALYRVLKEMGHERDKEEFTPPTRVYDEYFTSTIGKTEDSVC